VPHIAAVGLFGCRSPLGILWCFFLIQVAIALPLLGEIVSAAESAFIAPPGELCAGFELAPEPLDGVVGLDCPEMGSFEGYEGSAVPLIWGSRLLTCRPRGLAIPALLGRWRHSGRGGQGAYFCRGGQGAHLSPPPDLPQALSARFCSGLGSKSAHFRKTRELRTPHKELCVKT
jgi:hypothetical protein